VHFVVDLRQVMRLLTTAHATLLSTLVNSQAVGP